MRLWIKSHLKLKRGWSWTKWRTAKYSSGIKWKEQEIIWETGNWTIHMFTNCVPRCLKMSISWTLSAFNKHENSTLRGIPWGGHLITTELMQNKKASVFHFLHLENCSVCVLKLSAMNLMDYKYTWSLKASVWSFPEHTREAELPRDLRTMLPVSTTNTFAYTFLLTHPEYTLGFVFPQDLRLWRIVCINRVSLLW